MPIYEYKCSACGEHCEKLEKINDAPSTECPHCHQNSLTRQVTAAAFHLKGSGWYVTDFRDKDQKKPDNKQSSDDASPKSDKKEASSDVKQDKKDKKDTTDKGSKKSEKQD
ncbi:MAG: zinc ribbon domain-containing protein [Gammaproteobacteria bacterium]|nr:zinc ribbon domain-containing protein [Gammaproteobacteria bacterium]MCH9743940.1 zinc ribbon domain-containing protein [Gammaproteobacteria bacterium]